MCARRWPGRWTHDVETALRIAAPLWVYWSVNHLPEGRRWLQAALAQPSRADDRLRARALTTEGALACLLGDFAAGEAAARAAVALAQAADEPIVEARARWIVGASRLSAGQADGTMARPGPRAELVRAGDDIGRSRTDGLHAGDPGHARRHAG